MIAKMDDAPEAELERLIERASAAARATYEAYEPYEIAYRVATAASEMLVEATNTTTLPRAIVGDSASAR